MLSNRSLPLKIIPLIKETSDKSRDSSEKGKSPKFFSNFVHSRKMQKFALFREHLLYFVSGKSAKISQNETNEKISAGHMWKLWLSLDFFSLEIRRKFLFAGNPRESTILYQLLVERTLSFILLTTRQLGRDDLLNKSMWDK